VRTTREDVKRNPRRKTGTDFFTPATETERRNQVFELEIGAKNERGGGEEAEYRTLQTLSERNHCKKEKPLSQALHTNQC